MSVIRPIFEYDDPVWSAILDYLSIKLERIQKTAVRIMNPGASYEDSLNRTGLEKLSKRRDNICKSLRRIINYRVLLNTSSNIRAIASVTSII